MPSIFIPFVSPVLTRSLGVPPLLLPGPLATLPALALRSAPAILSALGAQQWGIFGSTGAPILLADAVAGVEFSQDYRISDYPQEEGAFASYNKVQIPFQAKVTFLVAQTRIAFLNSIAALLASLDLVTVVTPEVSYANANLTHYGYRRTSHHGVTMIAVDVWCEQVRLATSARFGTATQSPNGASSQNGGTVTPDQTTTAPTNAVTGQLLPGIPAINPIPSDTLLTSNISPQFYNQDGIPRIPNAAAVLNGSQQLSTLQVGSNLGASLARVSQPSVDGAVTVEYAVPAL